jgi:hypothetical protein
MGKILVLLLGLACVSGAAYLYLQRSANPGGIEDKQASAPKRQLDNVRGAAARIEQDSQKRADDLMNRTQ